MVNSSKPGTLATKSGKKPNNKGCDNRQRISVLPAERPLLRAYAPAFSEGCIPTGFLVKRICRLGFQAGLLRNKIFDAAKANDLHEVLADIDQYKQLKVDFPPALLLIEAKAGHKVNDPLRAFTALKSFLAVTPEKSQGYEEALRLYPTYENDAGPGIKKQQEVKANAAARVAELVRQIEGQMVEVAARSCHIGDKKDPANPEHWIQLRPFQLQKYDVTFDQYDMFAIATNRDLVINENGGLKPAQIGWDDVAAFISWLNRQSGRTYRLPTADEWECVARDGAYPGFPWGNEDAGRYGNFRGSDGKNRPIAPVGQFLPNTLGIYDMWGNVKHWTATCGVNFEVMAGKSAVVPDCNEHVERGGQWLDMFVMWKINGPLTKWNYKLGLRLASD